MNALSLPLAKIHSLPQILAALALGAGLIFSAGFAQSDVLHGAAHDVRHSIGFPCH